MHLDDEAWYRRCATTALDLVEEWGVARLYRIEPGDLEALRGFVRAEARRRKVRMRTYAILGDVYIEAREPSVIAHAYRAMHAVPVVVGLGRLLDADAPAPERVRAPYELDCALPLV
jgi:hypothetical protein